MTTADTQVTAAALVAMAEADIPFDVQELLVRGNPSRGIAPGALDKALSATRIAAEKQAREAERAAIFAMCADEARAYRHAQENAKNDTDKLYRMGQKDAAILLGDAVRARGEPA